jgi:uncharacterized protein (DUF58 family)
MHQEILKRVKKLEIKTKRPVEGLISGNWRSIFKGRGIEFSEVREYIPGDDIRAIDWNVTARFNSPFVKEYIEERDLNLYIVFDMSASNNFGSLKSKKESGYEVAASIMIAAMKNNDNIGLCLFTNHIERFFRPKKGKKHVLRLIREMVYHQPESLKTDIDNSLGKLSNIIKKHSIIFIISDFVSNNFDKPVKFLKRKHDVILINIADIRESEIPGIGYVYLEDEETGEQILINTSDEIFRKNFSSLISMRNTELFQRMKKLKVDMINIMTDEPFYVPVKKFFRMRERKTAK